MLPYHWDDREALYSDYLYLQAFHERALPIVAHALNDLHGLDHPLRYWRLVAGYWLMLSASVLLDRFRSIEAATRTGKVVRTIAMPHDGTETVVPSGLNFHLLACSDDVWNHHCYLLLIKRSTDIRIENLASGAAVAKTGAPRTASARAKVGIKSGLAGLNRIASRLRGDIVLLDLQLPASASVKLAWKLARSVTGWAPEITVPAAALRPAMRAKLALDLGSTEFERAFGALLPNLAPKSLVEDFAALRKASLERLPRRAKLIITGKVQFIEPLSIWAAEQRERGARFCIVQHGGHYGVDRFEAQEEHEIRAADRYYSWGWQPRDHRNVRPMPAFKLALDRRVAPKSDGTVLFVYDALPAYAYRLFAIPFPGQRDAYIAEQLALLLALPARVRDRARLRLHPDTARLNFTLDAQFVARGWGRLIDDATQKMHKALSGARLCVVTANATTFLQTFVMDYPTVLSWNPAFNEIREDARPYYDALHGAGILHHSPGAAASKIAEVFADPQGWWSTAPVQEARRDFVARYARTSPDWLDEWRTELRSMMNGNPCGPCIG